MRFLSLIMLNEVVFVLVFLLLIFLSVLVRKGEILKLVVRVIWGMIL